MNELLTSKNFILKLNPNGLTEQHKRLIRYLNIYILKSLNSDSEQEFFQCTEEAYKMLTALIKQSNFRNQQSGAPMTEQALELALDTIRDLIYSKDSDIYDN